MALRADFVLVGAGVYGTHLAWRLAARGADVLVLEATHVASGASGGFGKRGVRANGRDPRELPLARIANALWPELARELGADTGYERIGQLELFESEASRVAAEERVEHQRAHGVDTRLVSRPELRELEPDLSPHVLGAVHCPDDGVADHTATTLALARAARAHGARIEENAEVVGIDVEAGRAIAVHTRDGRRVEVGRSLALVANAGVRGLVHASTGVELPLWDVLPQALVTEPVPSVRVRHLIGHAERRVALKALPGGEVMITGGWLGQRNEVTGVPEVLPHRVAKNLAEALALYPALAGVTLRVAVADRVESVGPELVPLIDHVPGVSNAIFATGWTGHGWAIAPAVGDLLAAWLLTGEAQELLAPFALARTGKPPAVSAP